MLRLSVIILIFTVVFCENAQNQNANSEDSYAVSETNNAQSSYVQAPRNSQQRGRGSRCRFCSMCCQMDSTRFNNMFNGFNQRQCCNCQYVQCNILNVWNQRRTSSNTASSTNNQNTATNPESSTNEEGPQPPAETGVQTGSQPGNGQTDSYRVAPNSGAQPGTDASGPEGSQVDTHSVTPGTQTQPGNGAGSPEGPAGPQGGSQPGTAQSDTYMVAPESGTSGNQGGNTGANQPGNQGGNQPGNQGGNTGANQPGNQGGNTGGNQPGISQTNTYMVAPPSGTSNNQGGNVGGTQPGRQPHINTYMVAPRPGAQPGSQPNVYLIAPGAGTQPVAPPANVYMVSPGAGTLPGNQPENAYAVAPGPQEPVVPVTIGQNIHPSPVTTAPGSYSLPPCIPSVPAATTTRMPCTPSPISPPVVPVSPQPGSNTPSRKCCYVNIHDIKATITCGVEGASSCCQRPNTCQNAKDVTLSINRAVFSIPTGSIPCDEAIRRGYIRETDIKDVCVEDRTSGNLNSSSGTASIITGVLAVTILNFIGF